MRKFAPILLAISFILLLFACSNKTADFDVQYNVVGTEHNQYFEIEAQNFLKDLNANLEAYNLSLTSMMSSDLSTLFSENGGETWKVSVHTMGESDANLSPDTTGWAAYIKEVELSLFSDSEEDAKRNGQYIRALIRTFTPRAEEIVENALGIYGEPSADAVIAEGTYRATMENVSYVYQPGSKNNRGRFLVQPLDEALHDELNRTEPRVIRPEA